MLLRCSLALLSLLAFTAMSFVPAPTATNSGGWELLGSRKVNYALDRDEIDVTALEGRFTALKVVVRGAPLNMHKMVVEYGNGERDELEVRHNFGKGTDSRIIDLAGNRRIIRKVIFWYDTDNSGRRRATLNLWGKH